MKQNSSTLQTPSPTQIAEAAAWVAHLHGAARTQDSDRGLQLWLKDDPVRQRAWEVATEVWDDVGSLQSAVVTQALKSSRQISQIRRRPVRALTALAATLLVSVIALFVFKESGVATGIGEQRVLSLEDGTQVTLNTATRLVVHYRKHQRRIELRSGEALFDVAKHADRPFVVTAGEREIRALGTAFLVRRDESGLAVTLVEGKVDVVTSRQGDGQILSPGERLTLAERQAPKVDRPVLEKVTAWRRGQVVLEGARLEDAIAEMNRYSAIRLQVEDSRSADLRVSGVFRSGDSLSFANAVAATYQLRVLQTSGGISIAGKPASAYQ